MSADKGFGAFRSSTVATLQAPLRCGPADPSSTAFHIANALRANVGLSGASALFQPAYALKGPRHFVRLRITRLQQEGVVRQFIHRNAIVLGKIDSPWNFIAMRGMIGIKHGARPFRVGRICIAAHRTNVTQNPTVPINGRRCALAFGLAGLANTNVG